jgi:hypothetical protein
MDENYTINKIELSNGQEINVEMRPIGEQQISFSTFSFDEIRNVISTFSKDISEKMLGIADKTTLKFGVSLGIETNGIVAIIAKGTSQANLEVTLEWNK